MLKKDPITETGLLLAKERAYISLTGSMLYLTACLGSVVIVPSPTFLLLLLFREGPAANRSPSSLLEAGPRGALPCIEIVLRYEHNGSSSCLYLRGALEAKGHPKSYSLRLPFPLRCGKHCTPFLLLFWSPSSLPPYRTPTGTGKGSASEVRGSPTSHPFVPRTASSSRALLKTEILSRGKSPETQNTLARKKQNLFSLTR